MSNMDASLDERNLEKDDNILELLKEDCSDITPFELAYKYYNRLWSEAQNDLADLIQREPTTDEEVEVVSTVSVLVRRAALSYLQYIKVSNKLIKCYEHIPQPQKRILLRKMSEGCIGRALELKHELALLENSEFQFLDQALLSLKMLPNYMDIKVPEYFQEDCHDVKSEAGEDHGVSCKEIVSKKLAAMSEECVDPKYIVTEKKKFVKTAMVYLRLIQAHERARQAREHFKECQKKFKAENLIKCREASKDYQPRLSRPEAADIIQRSWRKYYSGQFLRKGIEWEKKFLGFAHRRDFHANGGEVFEKDRLRVIKRNEEEYSRAKASMREEYLMYRVPDMMEELEDRTRAYFQDYMELFGKYPDFPDEDEGGSTKMFELVVIMDEEQKQGEDKAEDSNKESKDAKGAKDAKGSKDAKGAKDAKGSKDAKAGKDGKKDGEEEGYKLKLSNFVPDLLNFQQEYENVWKGREPENFDRFDPTLLEQDVMNDLRLEVQRVVDNKMRIDLQKLVEAFSKDTKKKVKPKKKKKGKEKKGKGKKEKDLTPDRSAESLIEELVANGIIKSYPKCRLGNFVGDYNYSGSFLRLSGLPENDPSPCLGDIRRVVNEYCVLPLGSKYIHSKGAFVKSILVAGPRGVGKKHLVYGVCNEVNATLMDLSAENIDGKYPGDDGLEMLLHLILKVGRLVQPTVIFISDAENYFYKKIPPTCTLSDPGRLKKDLPKFLKGIGADDRILVFGTAFQPFDVDLKGLGVSYPKVICTTKPDYNCRRSLWRYFIRSQGGEITRELDMTVLCNVSDGFVASAMLGAAKEVLTERRRALQARTPLEAVEFLKQLANHVPVYEEEVAAYRLWLDKMPTMKKRNAQLAMELEEAGVDPDDEMSEED